MIQFEDSFFEEEVRNDFRISVMMKRAWAAQMEVLMQVDRVCRKNGIRYFANWGTLLGAVRHKGFIPWDDDIDLVMIRDDYQRFCKVAPGQLPEEYDIINVHQYERYDNMITRVVNSHNISCSPERLKAFHGCPYVVGVDIDILDYKSRNPQEDALQLQLLKIVLESVSAVRGYEQGEITLEELKEFLGQVEGLCRYQFDYDKSLYQQLRVLGEYLRMIYTKKDADELHGPVYRILHRPNYHMPIEWFDETVYLPFENVIEIPAPKEYDALLKLKYGDYMTPVNCSGGHDYPFYAVQEKKLVNLLKRRNIPGEAEYFGIDMSKYEQSDPAEQS